MVTHLEPDILEYDVKWALETITMNKTSGGDGIPAELFHILEDDVVKVTQYANKFGKLSSGSQDWKRAVLILVPKKGNGKECSRYCTIVLSSHASTFMLRTLQGRLQQYMNQELPDVHVAFKKATSPEIKLATFIGSRKTSTSASLTTIKPLSMLITTNCGKF